MTPGAPDPAETFRQEAQDLLVQLEDVLLDLDGAPGDRDAGCPADRDASRAADPRAAIARAAVSDSAVSDSAIVRDDVELRLRASDAGWDAQCRLRMAQRAHLYLPASGDGVRGTGARLRHALRRADLFRLSD